MQKIIVKKDTYFDSVFLMRIDKEIKSADGIKQSVVAMGTPHNLQLLNELNFSSEEISSAGPNDLVIALDATNEQAAENAATLFEQLCESARNIESQDTSEKITSLNAALKKESEINLALISVPGEYAALETQKCLAKGLNVMIFSDNVSVEDEIKLKDIAIEKNLLVMGPDCGTAIINGVPLAFANVVSNGNIGIVGASGTGIQEVTCLIDKFGGGITQAIGTGGRDLSEQVGARTALAGIAALEKDDATKVIVVISKPPAPSVAKKVVEKLKTVKKPCVVQFLGLKPETRVDENVTFSASLEETARLACEKAGVEISKKAEINLPDISSLISKIGKGRKYLRGLFTGGTLCDEAISVLEDEGIEVKSNIHHNLEKRLTDPLKSEGNSVIDLGDDVFTVGRPHPMIDPETRTERIVAELDDDEVAVFLFDVVLGYGSHPDPAGAVVDALNTAGDKRENFIAIASVTGTRNDFQGLASQQKKLAAAGIIILPSNYQASKFTAEILKNLRH